MNENYAVIHFNSSSMTEDTRYKLEKIIEKNIETNEQYFCCEGEEQTCYFKGTKEECEEFKNKQDSDVGNCMLIRLCQKKI